MTDFQSFVQLLAAVYFSTPFVERLYQFRTKKRNQLNNIIKRSLTYGRDEKPYMYDKLKYRYEVRSYSGIVAICLVAIVGFLFCLAYLYFSCFVRTNPDGSFCFWQKTMPLFFLLPFPVSLIIFCIYVSSPGQSVINKLDELNDLYQAFTLKIIGHKYSQIPKKFQSRIMDGGSCDTDYLDNIEKCKNEDKEKIIRKYARTGILFPLFDKVYLWLANSSGNPVELPDGK